MATTLFNQCNPRLIQVEDSCGCAVTRANIKAMTPSDFEADYWMETGMSRVVANAKEARMTGVSQRALTDLFLSRMVPLKQTNLTPNGGSVIAPFVYLPQQHRVNSNYFVITSGNVHPAAGIGAIPASAYQLIIINESSQFASPLVGLQNYFLPGRYLVAMYKDATNTGRTVQFKILTSANANFGGVERALVSVQPNVVDATWVGYTAPQKLVYQPTHGLVVPLANSISNYESWCDQEVAENTYKLKAFWFQTIRRTHCYNDEYVAAMNAPLLDDFFKKFRQVPLAQQKKRQFALAERAWYNTIWFGDKIDNNQTVPTYTDLPKVYDPANPSCLLEYKANTLGIQTQLAECGRKVDFQGGPLDLDLLKEALYSLKRTRSAGGADIQRIEAWTDRYTAHNILTIMVQYYKDTYGWDVTRFYQPKQELVFDGQVLWNYNVYDFPDEGVQLVVVTDTFFDDYLAAFPTADKDMGRYLWMIDWSDINIGLAGSKSVTRQTNVADDLYNCIITPVVNHYQLYSETIAIVVQDPNRHLIYNNFSNDCPTITANTCSSYVSGAQGGQSPQ
jgi:hypothetical protein